MTSRCEESSCFPVESSFNHCPIAQAPARATMGYSRNSVKASRRHNERCILFVREGQSMVAFFLLLRRHSFLTIYLLIRVVLLLADSPLYGSPPCLCSFQLYLFVSDSRRTSFRPAPRIHHSESFESFLKSPHGFILCRHIHTKHGPNDFSQAHGCVPDIDDSAGGFSTHSSSFSGAGNRFGGKTIEHLRRLWLAIVQSLRPSIELLLPSRPGMRAIQ